MGMALLNMLTMMMCVWETSSLAKECRCTYNNKGDVTAVDCSNAHLPSVPSDIPLTTRYLYLDHNNISFIPNGTFKELSFLSDLDLSFNHLSQLEANVFSGLMSRLARIH